MKNLGWINGWSKTPEIIKKCNLEQHEIKFEKISNCVTKSTCLICDYEYLTDSGD